MNEKEIVDRGISDSRTFSHSSHSTRYLGAVWSEQQWCAHGHGDDKLDSGLSLITYDRPQSMHAYNIQHMHPAVYRLPFGTCATDYRLLNR